MKKIINCAMASVLLVSASGVFAAVPDFLNFQGRLLDSNKLPRNGNYAVTFRICDSLAASCSGVCQAGNACLWTENQNINVANGVFAVQLGAVTPLSATVFSAPARYLEITVAGETLSPREQLVTAPYSFRAAMADGLASGALTDSQVAPAAAIAYSKLSLTGAVLNADLAGSIADTKLNTITTAGKVSPGAIAAGSLLNTVIASSIAVGAINNQNQIVDGVITNADLSGSIAYSKLSLTGAVLDADLAGSIAPSKITGTAAILGNNTFTGSQVLRAGTAVAGTSPLKFTAGTDLTAPEAGAVEYDGKIFSATHATNSRGVIPAMQFVAIQTDFTLVNGNAAQNCLTAANDTLTVSALTSYFFDAQYIINTGATNHTTAVGFVLGGGASVNSFEYTANTWSAAANTISTTQSTTHVTGVASKVINAASTAVYTIINLQGVARINAGGTIAPQITFSAAPGGTNLMKVGSYIRFYPIGSNTVAAEGNWN